jgi:hypothetical protein
MKGIFYIVRTIMLVLVVYPNYQYSNVVHGESIMIGQVSRFVLYQGGTSTVVTHLYDGAIVKVVPKTIPNFGLTVITIGNPIQSILFGYNNITNYRTEKEVPYSLCGNTDLLIKRCPILGIGTHRINATITNTKFSYIINFQIVYDIMNVPVTRPVTIPVPTPTPNYSIPIQSPIAVPTPVLIPPAKRPTPIYVPTPALIQPVRIQTPIYIRAPVVIPTIKIPTPAPITPVSPIVHLTYTLIYAGNNTNVVRIVNGMVINITDYPTANFNIRADTTNPFIQSIQFLPNYRVETSKPWAYCGNVGELYNTCDEFSVAGTYTITARIYTGVYPQGNVLTDASITFTIVGKPSSSPSNTTFPILINAGGPTIIDCQNRTWMTDSYFSGGSTYSVSNIDIMNTEDDVLYGSERYGNFVYQIPIPTGSYSVILHFAEIL